MRRKKNIRITTPIGTAQWPRLNEPDTKFNKDGTYSVSLRLTKEDAEPIQEIIGKALSDHMESLKKDSPKKKFKASPLPIKDVMDQDDNPTGEVEIRFKMNAIGINGGDRWEQRPALFDSSGRPLTETVGGGSKIKVGAEIVPYFTAMAGAGITLRLKAVQVIELIEYHKGDAFDSWEFSQEEGFVTCGEKEKETASAPSGTSDEDGFDF